MLRSRSNRQQRPSESTDERDGRGSSSSSSSYDYRGYPSSGPAGHMTVGIASGADDDDNHGGVLGRSSFGFGGGRGAKRPSLGGGGVRRGGSSFGSSHNGAGPARGYGKHNGNGAIGSAVSIAFAFAIVLTVALGGATFHYRRMIDRIEHELTIARRRTKGRRPLNRFRPDVADEGRMTETVGGSVPIDANEEENSEDNNDNARNTKDMIDLRNQRRELQGESHKWSTRATSMKHNVAALESQVSHVRDAELASYESQATSLESRLEREVALAKNYKEAFASTHKNGSSGIVPGGPGQATMQRREIEEMESLEDYEDYVERREDALWGKIDLLVAKLGRESRREAEEWFGPGPHVVELTVEYPKYTEDVDPSSWPRAVGTFQMEMAPLSLMPVAVNLFLQQVHHKLWNGCSFVINAMHIVQAGPHRFEEGLSGRYNANFAELVGRFESARLDKMPFQEYSAEYPHSKYTVGFAGRPGGPDFYINKVDNSVNHGPGGQSHHDLHEEADPCFARLVGGMEILEELNKVPVDVDRGNLLLHSVSILDSKVVIGGSGTDKDQMQDEERNSGVAETAKEDSRSLQLPQENDREKNNDIVDAGSKETNRNDDQGRGGGVNKLPAMGPGRVSE